MADNKPLTKSDLTEALKGVERKIDGVEKRTKRNLVDALKEFREIAKDDMRETLTDFWEQVGYPMMDKRFKKLEKNQRQMKTDTDKLKGRVERLDQFHPTS